MRFTTQALQCFVIKGMNENVKQIKSDYICIIFNIYFKSKLNSLTMIPTSQVNIQPSMTNRNQSSIGSSIVGKGNKGSKANGLHSTTSHSSKQESHKNNRPISCKKRKLSDSNQRLRGLNNNISNANGLAQSEMSRSQNSRGQSRGINQPSSGIPMLHNRLSQTGFSSGGLQSAQGVQTFNKNHMLGERKNGNKVGSRQNEREVSSSFGKQKDTVTESQAYNDSEGEVGDHCRFAERANGKFQNDPLKPLPHFERSVFDKYLEHQTKNTNQWNQTSIEPNNDGKINLANERKKFEDQKGGKHKKNQNSMSNNCEESYGCVVKGQNKHQLSEMPDGFALAQPQQQHLKSVHPQRITQKFQESRDTCITFDSDFCSGNLSKVQKGNNRGEYFLWISHDSAPYLEDGYRTWFYFSVHGVPQGEQLTFTFKNLNVQTKLYGQGLKPVFRVLPNTQKKWRRIFTKANYYVNNDEQFILRFQHMFSNQPHETTFFAFSYPFSYEESQAKIDYIQQQFQSAPPEKNLYFHRETVFYSIEGRKMECMTLSSRDGITDERETIPPDAAHYQCSIYPDAQNDPSKRPYRFEQNKKVVFFTCRVHPGESPGSHVLNGALDLITDLKSEQGRLLRKYYVFKIIPTLNPDGVARGYYRLDTLGQNLNRFYNEPDRRDQPTIWAAKKAISQYATMYKNLEVYMDFHAHASKKGVFIFGNALPENERQADNITFAKLIAMNCLNFDMNECNFSEKIMSIKDKNGMSRDGSSRVALQKATGLTHCYTLECNYHNGKRINTLAPKLIKGQGYIEEETPVTDPNSKIYANTNSPPFSQEIFEDVGNAVAVALLDHIGVNPISRIPLSCYRTVENVRDDIMNNLAKYSAGQVNVCGVNHFSSTNTKVSKNYQKTEAPFLKKETRTKQSNSASKDTQMTAKQGAAGSKPGTFGASKRIVPEKLKKVPKGSVQANANAAQGGGTLKQKTYSLGEPAETLLHPPPSNVNSKHHQYIMDNSSKNSSAYDPNIVLQHHQNELMDGLSPKQQQILQRNALQLRHEQFMMNSKISPSQLDGMTQHEQLMMLKQQQEYLLMKQQLQQMAMQSKQEQQAMGQLYGATTTTSGSNQGTAQQQRQSNKQGGQQQQQRLWSELSQQEQQMHLQYLKQQQKEMRQIYMLQQQQQLQNHQQKRDSQCSTRQPDKHSAQQVIQKSKNYAGSGHGDPSSRQSLHQTININESGKHGAQTNSMKGHQTTSHGHPPLAIDRQRMRDMSEKHQMARRNINLVDKQAENLIAQRAEYMKASQSEQRPAINPDRQTPGSQYSKTRKKKTLKEKAATTSNAAQSSNSKELYEGGSIDQNKLNQFEQQFKTNCHHKTPPPRNNNGPAPGADQVQNSLPQFIQQSADYPSADKVHLPDIEIKSQFVLNQGRSINKCGDSKSASINHSHQNSHNFMYNNNNDASQMNSQLITSPRVKQLQSLGMQHGPFTSFSNKQVNIQPKATKTVMQACVSLPQNQNNFQKKNSEHQGQFQIIDADEFANQKMIIQQNSQRKRRQINFD